MYCDIEDAMNVVETKDEGLFNRNSFIIIEEESEKNLLRHR